MVSKFEVEVLQILQRIYFHVVLSDFIFTSISKTEDFFEEFDEFFVVNLNGTNRNDLLDLSDGPR